jgi:hypothetical protein
MRDAVEHDGVPTLPDPFVVVVPAGQCEGVDVGLAAVDPVDDVVHLAAGRGFPAPWEGASFVAGVQGEPLPGGGEAAGAAVGEDAAGVV